MGTSPTGIPVITEKQISGPFQDVLAQQTFKAPELQPGAGFMGAGGKLAFLGSKILEGFQHGRMRKYLQDENTKQQQWGMFNNLMQNAMANADTPEKRQAISQLYSQTVWKGLNENLQGEGKGKGKKGGDKQEGIGGHIKGIIGSIAEKIGPIQKGSPSIGESLPMLNQALQAITGGMPSAQSQGDQGIKMMQEAAQETKTAGGWQQDLQSNPKWVKGMELAGRYIDPKQLKSVSEGLVNSFEAKPESRAQEERIRNAQAIYKRVTGKDMTEDDVAQLLGIKIPLPQEHRELVNDADSPTGYSYRILDRYGNILRIDQGITPPAGYMPESSTTVRFVKQADGTIREVPVTSTKERGVPGGGGTSKLKEAGAGPPGRIVGDTPVSQANLAVAQGAEGAMDSAVRAARDLPTLRKQFPNHFGLLGGGILSGLEAKHGYLPGKMAATGMDIHSVAAFLTGVHRARGKGYAQLWADALQDPWMNPEGTVDTLNRAAKIAEKVSARIKKNSKQPMTIAQAIRELDAEGQLSELDDQSVADRFLQNTMPPNPFSADKEKKGGAEPPGMKPGHVNTPFGPVTKPQ